MIHTTEYARPINLGTGLVAYKYKYFLDKEHPLASKPDGIVLYHRHVASVSTGRWLLGTEQVHHVDGDNLNNSPENLEVLTAAEHAQRHRPTFTETRYCAYCGAEMQVITTRNTAFCSNVCRVSGSIKDNSLSKEYLESIMPKHTWVSLGLLTGYSDTGIKKRAKALGCNLKIINSAKKSKLGFKH